MHRFVGVDLQGVSKNYYFLAPKPVSVKFNRVIEGIWVGLLASDIVLPLPLVIFVAEA